MLRQPCSRHPEAVKCGGSARLPCSLERCCVTEPSRPPRASPSDSASSCWSDGRSSRGFGSATASSGPGCRGSRGSGHLCVRRELCQQHSAPRELLEVTPRRARTESQPIAVVSVLHYLVVVLETPETAGRPSRRHLCRQESSRHTSPLRLNAGATACLQHALAVQPHTINEIRVWNRL
jgi:hypothetical protein